MKTICVSRHPLGLVSKPHRVVVGLVVFALFSVWPVLGATTWTVSSLGDDALDPTTLRGAIAAAASGDTIDISATGTITLAAGALVIDKNLIIVGPGANSLQVSGNNSFKLFIVNGGTTSSISGLTIADGFAPPGCCQVGRGAGIVNGGTLTLNNVTIRSNNATDGGGGISNGGTLTLNYSTVSGNTNGGIQNFSTLTLAYTTVSGNTNGGISNRGGGRLTLTNSTVTGNTGDGIGNDNLSTIVLTDSTVSNNSGSGAVNNGGTGSITNSTFSRNSADGIINHADGTLSLTNSTISGNSLRGIFNNWGTLILVNRTVALNRNIGGVANGTFGTLTAKNSLLANNAGGNCSLSGGAATSYGHNLSQDGSCASFFTAVADLNGISAGLDSSGLQNNGGPTQTIALVAGSAALDQIPTSPTNFCTAIDGTTSIATDQRGAARPQGLACDIGAFELVTNTPPVADAGPDRTLECANPAGTPVTLDGSASSDPDDDTLTYTWTGPFSEGGGTVTGVNPTVTLPLGISTVTLVVNDGTVDSAPDTVKLDIQVFVSGLQPPMVGLSLEAEPPLLPTKAFKQGSTIPLKLQLFCSGMACTNANVTPPRIVGLFATGGPIDLTVVDIDAGAANDNGVYFRFSDPNWVYNLSTQGLSAGTYTITIQLPDGRRFNAGFVLR